MKIKLTKKQKQNLQTLADFLYKKPWNYKGFDMSWYTDVPDNYIDNAPEPFQEYECGTICCAAGHGPLVGIKAKKLENWEHYVARVFGAKSGAYFYDIGEDEETSPLWTFCSEVRGVITTTQQEGRQNGFTMFLSMA